ncbi:MAG: hypothetical protein AB8B78_03695 [Polaribacter sp.]
MKLKIKTFCFIILSGFLINCSNNNEVNKGLISGKWNITKVIGGFNQPKDYVYGSLTWDFNFNNNTITIVNNADVFTDVNTPPSFRSNQGSIYTFSIKTENNIDFLVVGNRKGEIKFIDEELFIDYGIAFDDIAYVFKR